MTNLKKLNLERDEIGSLQLRLEVKDKSKMFIVKERGQLCVIKE